MFIDKLRSMKKTKINIFHEIRNFNCRDDYISFIKTKTYMNCSEIDNISRPEHVCAVYCLGMNLLKKMYRGYLIPVSNQYEGIIYVTFVEIWTYMSLFHDIGYGYQTYEPPDDYNPNIVRLIYLGQVVDLLEKMNNEWATAYNVDELVAYYYYIYQKRVNENILAGKIVNTEVHEHGILGGALASVIMRKNQPLIMQGKNSPWYYITLATALSIAQHNIWPVDKLDLREYDIYFSATNVDKNKFVEKNNKLDKKIDLLSFFLCLIDSIDITKRLTDIEPYNYSLINDVLKQYKIKVFKHPGHICIRIYARAIRTILNNNGLSAVFDKWIFGIRGMGSFLNIKYIEHKNDCLDIKIEDHEIA